MYDIDIDKIVDYKAEYTAVIEKYKVSDHKLVGLCPFHEDKEPSFSVDLITGKWHCLAEGDGGNFVTFWARLHGIDSTKAYHEILDKYGVNPQKTAPAKNKGKELLPYSVEEYSREKKLPEEFLKTTCRISTGRDRNGMKYLRIPYYFEDGKAAAVRQRYGQKGFRWMNNNKGKICLYGEWRLPDIRKGGWVVLCEGESDSQSLWYMGIPALGIPGADMFKAQYVETLHDLKLFIHKEPDQGGETFVRKICQKLSASAFKSQVHIWTCEALGTKDPSDLYIKHGQEEAAKMIRDTLSEAQPIDLDAEITSKVLEDAPIRLREPDNWTITEDGISETPDNKPPQLICKTPIILTKRIKKMGSGEEKIEAAFKRDKKWQTVIYPRSTIFNNKAIMTLADLGCTITSENAKSVVRFLGALENENLDKLPLSISTDHLGWHPGDRFLPGIEEDIVLDLDPTQMGMASAVCQKGELKDWIAFMAPHRENLKFRFIMAAAFVPPLLKILKERNFILYNWGPSGGGKSAALYSAISAWGEPERLKISFDATKSSLERRAALFTDLPLEIDERQQADNKQDFLDKLVYMLGNGVGRARATKAGLQEIKQWRTVAMGTGEEPLTSEATRGGVKNRLIEIYGAPFEDKTRAKSVYKFVSENHGTAGLAFIRKLIAVNKKDLAGAFEKMQAFVDSLSGEFSSSHVAYIAETALVDAMIDSWFFREPAEKESDKAYLKALGIYPESWMMAKTMAAEIMQQQIQNNQADTCEGAVRCIVDFITAYPMNFYREDDFHPEMRRTPCYGYVTENTGETIYYIIPSFLRKYLKDAGYGSPLEKYTYMSEIGLISTTVEKSGKIRREVQKRFEKKTSWFIEFFYSRAVSDIPEKPSQTSLLQNSTGDLPF